MATLNSPGVSVTVVDESFYLPVAPGTVPLIFVASASNKSNGSGTGTALGTLDANAGKVWTITSQRDLVDTFGVPYFETDANGNPVHGGELNEYGLQAAYSLLGISSQAYIVRADVDTEQLSPTSSIPNGAPASGTYWLDTDNSLYGISEWDATNGVFVNKTPLIIDNSNKETVASLNINDWIPNPSFGVKGNYAITVTSENTNQVWFKNSDNNWVLVGSNAENFSPTWNQSTCWQTSWPVVSGSTIGEVVDGSSFSINGNIITVGPDVSLGGIVDTINSIMYEYGVGAKTSNGKLFLYADGSAASNGLTQDGKIALEMVGIDSSVLGTLGLVEGLYDNVAISVQPHTQVPNYFDNNPTGSVYIKTTAPNNGASWVIKYYNGATKTWNTVAAPIYPSSEAAIYAFDKTGGLNIPVGTLYIESNYDHGSGANLSSVKIGEFKVYRRNAVYPTTISYKVPNTFISFNDSSESTFYIKETLANNNSYSLPVTVTLAPGASLADFVTAVSAAGLVNVSANYDATSNTISISHALGGDFKLLDGDNNPLTGSDTQSLGFAAFDMTSLTGTLNLYSTGLYEPDGYQFRASNWKPLIFEAKTTAPYTTPADGQLWFSSIVDEVDIMYHDGNTWVGYQTAFPGCDPNGPLISATAPTTQSDGSPLSNGDIWISTANIENYGSDIYVWNGSTLKWITQDVTDQVTSNGWLFADARWAITGQSSAPSTIKELLNSDYLDPDAPDPSLYPAGIRLWNLRRSGYNVKKYVSNYINIDANDGKNIRYDNESMDDSIAPYFADRWVSASPNNANGSGTFGRFAQRGVVVSRFKSLIDTNQAIRDTDTLVFNLIACPGYPETVQNMIAFNNDRKQTAFILGDTPFRLSANGTDLAAWGNNTNNAFDNGDDGAVSYDNYMAFYYPSGYTNDNLGNNIVVPPSHIMLRTIAKSDNVSFPWFAPAGLRRGIVDNVTSVGYINSITGEFQQTSLYESLRDVMAQNGKINPIATLPGSGIVVMGQYTRASVASALDRVNVSRLVAYLRRQLEILSRPFLFEPNDKITRDEIKAAAESLLLELVGQRALYDFLVVCDESNNTPARIDRSELWMDIAIEPVKAVEFIYIPLRIVNTGEIKAGI